MLCTKFFTAFVTVALTLASATAFTTQWSGPQTTTSLQASRRAFIDATAVAFVVTAGLQVQPAFATDDADDLAMPTEDEQKKANDAFMAERLRRKAELQKAASKPMTIKESMEVEKKKQNSLQKSKEERRDAMCEELGRGC